MKKSIIIVLTYFFCISTLSTQTVDLSSVDEFLNVTDVLLAGKNVRPEHWKALEETKGYSLFSEREDKFLINTIKSSLLLAFGNSKTSQIDSILNYTTEDMENDRKLFLKKLILKNFLEVKHNYDSIIIFRNNYNFIGLIEKSKQRLSSFMNSPLDPSKHLNPVNLFFTNADGADYGDAIYIDFNLRFNMTEDQRINFLTHEYFHNYRRYFENNDFNHKSDINFCLDMIQNEGIADQIDKSSGFIEYYSNVLNSTNVAEIMKDLYRNAENDMMIIEKAIVQFSENKISEEECVDQILEVYGYNGHHIGYFMSEIIVSEGYRNEMVSTFNNPYEFFRIYNLAAAKSGYHKLSSEFILYLEKITEEHY